MFNKDQYDQEEYDKYYRSETEDAEILGGRRKNKETGSLFIIFFIIALISSVLYFKYDEVEKFINGHIVSNSNNSTIHNEKELASNNKKEDEEDLKSKVEEAIESNGNISAKISPEDIANIVQLVMIQMKEENKLSEENSSNKKKPEEFAKDSNKSNGDNDIELMQSLNKSEVDTLENRSKADMNISKKDTRRVATNNKNIEDTYNKVVVQHNPNSKDELSRISNGLSQVTNNDEVSLKSNNSEFDIEMEKEVKDRRREMRYVIVRKGDTLGKIAKRVYGNVMAYKKIYEANPDILKRPDKIYVGQKLRVPE